MHTLYSYRRCPYAMRARMALFVAGIQCEVHEINFRDKPATMLAVSPKGTVPVLVQDNGAVLEESIDIMLWALTQNDPQSWLEKQNESLVLIVQNDGAFKAALDRYKYPNRFPDEDCSNAREEGLDFLYKLDDLLMKNKGKGLLDCKSSLADIAIFPFVRQFANVDKTFFDMQKFSVLQFWLQSHISSKVFQMIFKKYIDTPYEMFDRG